MVMMCGANSYSKELAELGILVEVGLSLATLGA